MFLFRVSSIPVDRRMKILPFVLNSRYNTTFCLFVKLKKVVIVKIIKK